MPLVIQPGDDFGLSEERIVKIRRSENIWRYLTGSVRAVIRHSESLKKVENNSGTITDPLGSNYFRKLGL